MKEASEVKMSRCRHIAEWPCFKGASHILISITDQTFSSKNQSYARLKDK
jgi:hypothetical protein